MADQDQRSLYRAAFTGDPGSLIKQCGRKESCKGGEFHDSSAPDFVQFTDFEVGGTQRIQLCSKCTQYYKAKKGTLRRSGFYSF